MRSIRGLLIAIAALAISASAVFAALPQAANFGLDRSSQAQQQGDRSATSEAPDESASPSEAPDPSEPADTQTSSQASQGDHGALVSQAAQGDTPAGWPNHGAYVSAVARGLVQPGAPAPAGLTTHGNSAHHGKPSK